MAEIDAEQREELEAMIRELEEENATLQAEYEKLRLKQTPGSTPEDGSHGRQPDCDMIAEAKLLRQHKGRLEARMQILEDHNRQLEAQLQRLRQLLEEVCGTPTKYHCSVYLEIQELFSIFSQTTRHPLRLEHCKREV